jgi:hypothetical protein
MSTDERQNVQAEWEKRWDAFLDWMLEEYAAVADGNDAGH